MSWKTATSSTFATVAEKIAGNFQFLEGPVWVQARNELLFSDIPASCIRRYTPATNSFSIFREPSGQANGNALDPQGRLVTCEHENRRTSRTEHDGTVNALATHYEGKRLNSPNDIVCRSDGSVYFSDPPYGVKPDLRELDFQGVFCVSPKGETLTLVARDFVKPNGLAFSPDEKILYIADTELGHLRAFDVNADGSITNSRVFCKVERPDGFRVNVEGTLYISAMKSVEILTAPESSLAKSPCPSAPPTSPSATPTAKPSTSAPAPVSTAPAWMSPARNKIPRHAARFIRRYHHAGHLAAKAIRFRSRAGRRSWRRSGSGCPAGGARRGSPWRMSAANSARSTRKLAPVFNCFFSARPEKSKCSGPKANCSPVIVTIRPKVIVRMVFSGLASFFFFLPPPSRPGGMPVARNTPTPSIIAPIFFSSPPDTRLIISSENWPADTTSTCAHSRKRVGSFGRLQAQRETVGRELDSRGHARFPPGMRSAVLSMQTTPPA